MSTSTPTGAPRRMRWALLIIFAVALVLAARLFQWQIIEWDKMSKRVYGQATYTAPLYGRRGSIYSGDGLLLATDVFLYTITAYPQGIVKADELAQLLAPILKQSPQTIFEKLAAQDGSVVLARDVSVEIGGAVLDLKARLEAKRPELGLGSIAVEAKPVRRYPGGAFAAQCIGYVNAERNPANGVEQFKDVELRGVNGEVHGAGNALREIIPFDPPTYKPATDGKHMVLAINSGMQRIVEAELANAIRESRSASGSIVVMDPKTGAVLALAAYPSADLNAYRDPANQERYKNTAVSAQYEPGSVFKIVTLAAGLDAGAIAPHTVFDDEAVIYVGGKGIWNHDRAGHGRVTVVDFLRLSLNVEAAKIGVALGAERFYQYVRKFGFGVPTRVELAGEVAGDVKLPGDGHWRDIDLATNSFGQGIAVTPMQMVTAVAAVANQGNLMRPYIVQEVQDADGRPVYRASPQVVRQVIRPEIAQTVTRLLGEAILGESSNKAAVPGYRVAGKTGTAQISSYGKYDDKWTIASFAGYLPADDPRFVVLVRLDKPQSSPWGSQVASPVFAAVAKQLAAQAGLPPDAVRAAR